jgi:hypothetical protein
VPFANAHLRVHNDPSAEALTVPLDAVMLGRMQMSTWRTDAGDLDVLADIPDELGKRHSYEDLVHLANRRDVEGRTVVVAPLSAIIASKKYANRPKDREALPELERLAAEVES